MTWSPVPDNELQHDPGQRWLRAQATLDWSRAGLAPYSEWDPALASAMRTIAVAPIPMALMIGPRGVLVANTAAQQLFAETAGPDPNGRSVLDVLPDSADFYAPILKRVLARESVTLRNEPIRLIQAGDPVTRWFNLDFVPVTDAAGTPLAVLGFASEVTAHIDRIRELSEAEHRLQFALEGSGLVGIWTFDAVRNQSAVDANVARMHDLPVDECAAGLAVDRYFDAIHPDDRARVRQTLEDAIAAKSAFRCRYRVTLADDALRWVVASAKPVLDEDEMLARLLGVVVDVTEQVETASALAETRFQFQTLTEAMPQIVWSCDAEGRHDYFSERWSEFTGIAQEDITEETWKTLVDPEHWTMVREVWDRALETGESYDIDYRFRHHSGEYRWLRVMALPIRNEEGRIVRWSGTSTDVHETYLIAEERERLAQEMERIATEDQLTKVLTRRAFMSRSEMTTCSGVSGARSSPCCFPPVTGSGFRRWRNGFEAPSRERRSASGTGSRSRSPSASAPSPMRAHRNDWTTCFSRRIRRCTEPSPAAVIA